MSHGETRRPEETIRESQQRPVRAEVANPQSKPPWWQKPSFWFAVAGGTALVVLILLFGNRMFSPWQGDKNQPQQAADQQQQAAQQPPQQPQTGSPQFAAAWKASEEAEKKVKKAAEEEKKAAKKVEEVKASTTFPCKDASKEEKNAFWDAVKSVGEAEAAHKAASEALAKENENLMKADKALLEAAKQEGQELLLNVLTRLAVQEKTTQSLVKKLDSKADKVEVERIDNIKADKAVVDELRKQLDQLPEIYLKKEDAEKFALKADLEKLRQSFSDSQDTAALERKLKKLQQEMVAKGGTPKAGYYACKWVKDGCGGYKIKYEPLSAAFE